MASAPLPHEPKASLTTLCCARLRSGIHNARASIRNAALRQLSRKMIPGGVVAVVIDPRRAVPGLTSAVAESLGRAVGSNARVFIVPHSFFTPSILIVARKPSDTERIGAAAEAFQFRVRVQLRDRGFPLHKNLELDLLEASTDRERIRSLWQSSYRSTATARGRTVRNCSLPRRGCSTLEALGVGLRPIGHTRLACLGARPARRQPDLVAQGHPGLWRGKTRSISAAKPWKAC